MSLHWPSFFTRLASAIVFAAVMMTCLLWNEWAMLTLVSAISILCLFEYFRMLRNIYPAESWPLWLMPISCLISLCLLWIPPLAVASIGLPSVIAQQKFIPPLLASIPVLLLATCLSPKNALFAGLAAVGGLCYITMPAMMLYNMRLQSLLLPLALVLLIWMNDTMAYLVGSFAGRTPFSKVSPKKTWEGTAGGALLTMALAMAWGYYSKLFYLRDWAVLALCASIAGTAGDLFESKLKRLAGVKDSGKIMPGHGGALDRFDSLLIATPFAFCYAYLFMGSLQINVF